MYLLGFVLLLVANYLLYLRSEKITHVQYGWEKNASAQRKVLGYGSVILLLFSGVLFFVKAGILGGLAFGGISYFMIASATLLVRPLLTPERSKKAYAGK